MILIVAVDDHNGLLFHNRRQSQDRLLRARIVSLSAHSRLWMNSYTEAQFAQDGDLPAHLCADDAFLEKAAPGEYCFVENASVAPYEARMEEIILFRWNRSYPGDFYFDIDLSGGGWTLVSTEDFPGFSHEKITMEVYRR